MDTRITVEELRRRILEGEPIQLVDVRSVSEFDAAHVPCAVNIPLEKLQTRVDDLGDTPIAVLCQSGNRAEMGCEQLKGFKRDVLVVEGGTTAWTEKGFPVVQSQTAKWSLERQVRFGAGLLVLAGTLLALLINVNWIFLAMFVGAGLTFAGLTNICGMAALLAILPWNKPQSNPNLKKKVSV